MSWTDPCRECGEPRYGCECKSPKPTPMTKEELDAVKKQKEVCKAKGHEWEYTFIIYQCKRCGEISNY